MLVAFWSESVHQLLDRGWLFGALVLAETLWPRTSVPLSSRLRGLALSAVYAIASAALIVASALVLQRLGARPLFHFQPSLGGALAATLGTALLADFGYYWYHRAAHRWFWRFHGVHHAIRELNAVNSYNHWTEELWRWPFMALPLAFLTPVGAGWVPWIGAAFLFQSYYLHSDCRLHLGPLRFLICDNRSHRIHHSIEPEHHDKNFGVFTPLWDHLFGTAYVPADDEWPDVGVADIPEADGLASYIVQPFTLRRAAHISDGLITHTSQVSTSNRLPDDSAATISTAVVE